MNKKGFTLVELLAIVGLLGILAAVTIPNVNREIKSNEKQTLKMQKTAINNAAHIYVAKYYADKLVEGDKIEFTLSDLEKDGLLTIPDECNDVKDKNILVNGKNYDYGRLGSCYSAP